MAGKNWLIRTKNKQILGPATKDKVIELIEKGSLTPDDEITSGNGYWFWIREGDLIDKYLYGDVPQGFNPISEAEDVLTATSSPDGITASVTETPQPKAPPVVEPAPSDNQLPDEDDLAYPDEDELAYPDMGDSFEEEEGANEEELIPDDDDLAYPDMDLDTGGTEEVLLEVTEPGLDVAELSLDEDSTEPVQSSSAAQEPVLEEIPSEGEENYLYPDAADLEYPILEGEDPIGEPVEDEEVALDEDVTDPNVVIPTEIEAPSQVEQEVLVAQEEPHEEVHDEEPPKKKAKKKKVRKKKRRKVVTERKGNDRYLFLILLLLCAAIGVVFYYYKVVLNKPFPVLGIHSAQAQTLQSLSKKKVF